MLSTLLGLNLLGLVPIQIHHQTRRALLTWTASAAVCALPTCGALADKPAFSDATCEAYAAFSEGDYDRAEREWRRASIVLSDSSIVWLNFGSSLVILASAEMKLGVKPTGRAAERLREALEAFDAAERLGDKPDSLLFNSRGNALSLLQHWPEARAAYEASAAASPRDFESIPRSNSALVSFELGDLVRAEREAAAIIRRDPRFVNADALLAAIRWQAGDVGGAVRAVERLCEEPTLCQRYSTVDVVLGRWTPAAVEAYRGLLGAAGTRLAFKEGGVRL